MKRFAIILLALCTTARADWTNWHPSAWTNYRSTVETVGVFATSHSYVLTNGTTVTTNAFLSNIYAASNGTSIVSTFAFVLTQTNGAVWTNSITTTNLHTATNLVLAPREIVCFDLYRAMRERDAALCAASSAKESVRFYRYERDNLTYAKSWLADNIANFISTNQPAQSFQPLNVTGLLLENGLPTNYLAQTPYRALWCGDTGGRMVETSRWFIGTSTNITTNVLTDTCGNIFTNIGAGVTNIYNGSTGTLARVCTNATPYEGINSNGATWGFCGITNLFNALQWTKAGGVVENCGGRSNVIASTVATVCNTDTLDSNYTFAASSDGFPLYEARKWAVSGNVTYEGIRVEACWVVPDFVTPAACPTGPPFTGFIPEPPGTCFTITSRWSACNFIPADSNNATCSGTTIDFIWSTYTVTNTITNACDPNYLCPLPESAICSHLAPITFENCTNRYGTNVVADFEQWFNIGSTGTCAGAGASFTDPFGYGMAVGWTNLFANTNSIGAADSLCNTNFAGTNRIPWIGSTTSTAWAVYDAALIKKWRFQYR